MLAVFVPATGSKLLSQDRSQVFRTGAVGVVVDAVVRDAKGRLVRCLSKPDFRVTEDGKEQQIEGFEIVGSAACANVPGTASESKAAVGEISTTPPVTAIVFEELGAEARAAAFRVGQVFLREGRLDREFVGIFTLDFAIHTIVPYTRDDATLLDGIRHAATRPGCPVTVTGVIPNADAGTSCTADVGEAKVKATLSGLQAVVRTLAALPGRKNILLFSEGFRVSTAESAVDRLERLIANANQSGVTFYAIDALGLRTIDGRQATRQRLSSYAGGEETGGVLTTDKEDANALLALDPTAALAHLAQGTGGEFVGDTNALEDAVRRLAGEIHEYYRLSYRPTDQSPKHAYRKIAVQVSVPGAVVQTRSGYYADSERRGDIHMVGPAEVAPHLILDGGTTPHDFAITTHLHATERQVQVQASVPAKGLAFRMADGRFEAGVTILARAIGRDKDVMSASSESFLLSGPSDAVSAARTRTVEFSKTLPLKNARTVEIIAYDAQSGHASVERHDLSELRK